MTHIPITASQKLDM